MPTPWTDLDRPPLSAARLSRAVVGTTRWQGVDVVPRTVSTNADLAAAARRGETDLVRIAEQQTGGRGRLDRRWEAPARAAVLLSCVTRPAVPARALPLAPLVAGLAAVEAARGVAGVPAVLKWPNDVLVAGAKLGGILVERVGDAVVIGVGLNVSTRRDELPTDAATSVALAGGTADREPIAAELLRALDRRLADWERGGGAPAAVLPAYRAVCATMGARVRVTRPDGAVVTGTALDVTDDGLLVVRGDDGVDRTWSAGDVTHVRTEG